MADPMITEIENEIRGNKVMIYMKGTPSFPQCGFSAATIEIFEELGRPFGSVDVLSQPAKRDAIKRYSNWPTIPQVYVDGKFIGGCDIVREMHARGELKSCSTPRSPASCARAPASRSAIRSSRVLDPDRVADQVVLDPDLQALLGGELVEAHQGRLLDQALDAAE